jgi:spore coat protein U domain-containing protein, fimbrial subunit CupE1/2/3/6
MVNWRRMVIVAAGCAIFLSGRPARGAITCTISTTNVGFGSYDVFSVSPTDSTGGVTYNCKGVGQSTITIDLDRGIVASTFLPRKMSGPRPTDSLNYNLYLDAAHTVIWGDGSGGTSEYGPILPPNNTDTTVTIYARTPAGQDVSGGSYSDTVTATINF